MPLTQEQITQLKPLTQHSRFGQLLKDAMKTWEKATPIQFDHGLAGDNWNFRSTENPCCCLLGAAFVDKGDKEGDGNGFSKALREIYRIENEAREFTRGFDNRDLYFYSEAYDFACEVRKILFGK